MFCGMCAALTNPRFLQLMHKSIPCSCSYFLSSADSQYVRDTSGMVKCVIINPALHTYLPRLK